MDENGPFMDDLPIQNCDFPVRYVSLPGGNIHMVVCFSNIKYDNI